MVNDGKIQAASAKHPIVPLAEGKSYAYGTAGFRMNADLLEGIAFRVGLVASLRSRNLGGKTIGVMVTASHNPAIDNGVKIVEPMGEMLIEEWEAYSTKLVNCKSDQELAQVYAEIATKTKTNLNNKSNVIFGRDTRPSGHKLVGAIADALDAVDTPYIDYKILTTPQLHYLTCATNTEGLPQSYGKVSEVGYYEKFADAFVRALRGRKINGKLTVDCANGVGGPKLNEFLKYIPKDKVDFEIKVVNDDVLRPEVLNLECGADFVKTKQRTPVSPKPELGVRSCSLDGDADRLMYYWTNEQNSFFMLDGDRISSLAASFINEQARIAGIQEDLHIGVVQTAYANGASTNYIQEHLRLPVVCTPTGVKYLHHAATRFDIGVYFEANGHGTILFSQDARRLFKEKKPQSPAQKDALDTLAAVADLVNQTVGDAISDMLLVEVILAHQSWSLKDWAMTYTDLPNRLVRVEVKDKNLFTTTDAERRLLKPEGAQAKIDAEVQKYNSGRSFARASGTENACRVYAEAATQTQADELAVAVGRVVKAHGGDMV